MPHAALWVVQPERSLAKFVPATCFNAARGFVGGAASVATLPMPENKSFNAARGFVGGAATDALKKST